MVLDDLDALRDIFMGNQRSSKKGPGKGKKGIHTYVHQEAHEVALAFYPNPRLLDFLVHEDNAGGTLYLFNAKAFGDVAKKLGYSGRSIGTQLKKQLTEFVKVPFELDELSKAPDIGAAVNFSKAIFLLLVSPSSQLDAACIFLVSKHSVFISWLVVATPCQSHRVGTFFLSLIEDLVSMVQPPEHTCTLYTQFTKTSKKLQHFYFTRLAFYILHRGSKLPKIEGATWMWEDQIYWVRSVSTVPIKEISPPTLEHATIESLSSLVRRIDPELVQDGFRSSARWDGTVALELYQPPWSRT